VHEEDEMDSAPTPTIAPPDDSLREDVISGLTRLPKRLPSKYFYDERGSRLFDRICALPEYYPTRTELAIMRRHGPEMADYIGPRAQVVELGAGNTRKIRLLLQHLEDPAGYVPVDISESYLLQHRDELAPDFPAVPIRPLAADFTKPFALPDLPPDTQRRVVYFSGSTIGNLGPAESQALLTRIAQLTAPAGGLLIGLDLKKETPVLEAAYNDQQGVTRAFNLNILRRLQNELDAAIDIDQFEHQAFYNEEQGRIEMHLVSLQDQTIQVAEEEFPIERGETIHTENSYKFDLKEFGEQARGRGLEPVRSWTDPREWFGVQYLAAPGPADG
jgi:dimethylhistidine N-methyltransferase